jgi:hypothetical protein
MSLQGPTSSPHLTTPACVACLVACAAGGCCWRCRLLLGRHQPTAAAAHQQQQRSWVAVNQLPVVSSSSRSSRPMFRVTPLAARRRLSAPARLAPRPPWQRPHAVAGGPRSRAAPGAVAAWQQQQRQGGNQGQGRGGGRQALPSPTTHLRWQPPPAAAAAAGQGLPASAVAWAGAAAGAAIPAPPRTVKAQRVAAAAPPVARRSLLAAPAPAAAPRSRAAGRAVVGGLLLQGQGRLVVVAAPGCRCSWCGARLRGRSTFTRRQQGRCCAGGLGGRGGSEDCTTQGGASMTAWLHT